jgi:hypothetical protein
MEKQASAHTYMHLGIFRSTSVLFIGTHRHTHTHNDWCISFGTPQADYDENGLLLSNIRDHRGNLVPAATDEFFRKKFAEFQHMHIVVDPEEVRVAMCLI